MIQTWWKSRISRFEVWAHWTLIIRLSKVVCVWPKWSNYALNSEIRYSMSSLQKNKSFHKQWSKPDENWDINRFEPTEHLL